ncbi:MAG: hypothetical protein M1429_04335 [Patescibacteria group bacterium]|nr:hypothetical protein [Patescibacteria group bacterium]
MKKIFLSLFLSSLVLIGLLLASPYSSKAANRGIQISPLTFNLDIPTNGTGSGKIIVTNLNNADLNYALEVENFAGVTDDGAVTFAGKEEQGDVTTLADWFTFDAPKEGTIPPNKDKEINFTIQIPQGAEPGGHYAAIFAREVKKSPTGQAEVGIASRVGALVLVSVPGQTSKTAEITDFTYPKFVWRGPNEFTMKVLNTGTVHFDSQANVELKSIIGTTTNVDMGKHTLIPKNTRSYIGNWATKYPFGYYKVTAKAINGNNQPITTTGVIWAIPLIIVIPIIIILIIIILLIKYIRKHYRYVSTTKPSEPKMSN